MSPNVCLFGVTIILRKNRAEIALLGGTFALLRKSPPVRVSLSVPERGWLWIRRDSYWGEAQIEIHVTTTPRFLLFFVTPITGFPHILLLLSLAQGILRD